MQNISSFASALNEAVELHRRGSLEEADACYRMAKQSLKGDGAALEVERRRLLQHQARLYTALGAFDDALKHLRELRKLTESAFGAHHWETAVVLRKLADVLQQVGQTAEARALSGVALENWLMFAGCKVKAQPDNNDFDALFGVKPGVPAADVLYSKILEKIKDGNPDAISCDLAMSRALTDIASLIFRHGASHQANEISRFALFHFERLPVEHAWAVPECLFDFADHALSLSHSEQCAPVLRKYLNLFEHNFGAANDVSADLWLALGCCLTREKRCSDACECFERTLSIFSQWSSADNPRSIGVFCNFANCCLQSRDYSRAESMFKQALKLATQIAVPNKTVLLDAYYNLSRVYVEAGDTAEAERVLLVGLQMVAEVLGPESKEMANFLRKLAEVYMLQRRHGKAMTTFLRCFELLLLHMSEDREEIYDVRKQCVAAYRECARFYDAEVTLNRMIELLEKDTSKNGLLQLAWTNLELGKIQRLQGRYALAERTLRRTLSMFEDAFGFASVETCTALEELADCLLASWRFPQAERACRRIIGDLAGADSSQASAVLVSARLICARARLFQSDKPTAHALVCDAVALCRQRAELDDHVVVHALAEACRLLIAANDPAGAAALCDQMQLYIREHCSGKDLEEDPLYAHYLESQAAVISATTSDPWQPIALLRRAMAIRERLQGHTHLNIAGDLREIAVIYKRALAFDKAEDAMFKALQIYERTAAQHGMLGEALILQAAIMHAREKAGDGLALSRRAIAIWDLSPPSPAAVLCEALQEAVLDAKNGNAPDVVSALSEHIERMKPLVMP